MHCLDRFSLGTALGALFVLFLFIPGMAFAQGLSERLEGQEIESISFRSNTNLDYEDLISSVVLRPGDVLTRQKLSDSIARLYERGVFSHVDFSLRTSDEGVLLEFLLTPALTISEIRFRGNTSLEERVLLRLVGIRAGELLDEEKIKEAQRAIAWGYRDLGFYSAQVAVDLRKSTIAPRVEVVFEISEGKRSEVTEVELRGEFPEELSDWEERFREQFKKLPAARGEIDRLRRTLVVSLRKEGYLQATAEIKDLIYEAESGELRVVMSLSPGVPLSLVFPENALLSPEELLAPLKLETRTVPFTPSAIPRLCREIVKLYEQRGYFDTKVRYEEVETSGERRVYRIEIEEGTRLRISELAFRGNENVSDGELQEIVETRAASNFLFRRWRPGILIRSTLESDREAIVSYYRALGYFGVTAEYQIEPIEESEQVRVLFLISEVEETRVRSVELVWKGTARDDVVDSELIRREDLLRLTPEISVGDPYRDGALRREARRLERVIQDFGYPNASVEFVGDRSQASARFIVSLGALVRIGRIVIQGNVFTHDFVIQEKLGFEQGDFWRPENVRRSVQALYQLGFFNVVSIEPLDGLLDQPVEDVRVRVFERNTGSFGAGIGFNTEDGVQILAEVAQRNWRGNGGAVVLGVDAYFKPGDRVIDAGSARAAYERGSIFGSSVGIYSELFGQFAIKFIDEFSYDRVGLNNTLRFPFTERFRASVGLSTYREDIFDVAPDVIIGPDDEGENFLSLSTLRLEYDARDNIYNPRSGFRSILETQIASEFLGSEISFGSVDLKQSLFLPIFSKLTWANNLSSQYLFPMADTDVVPISERVFLGGRRSLRGFKRNSVGPRNAEGNVVGGDFSLVLNSEFQYGFTEEVIGVLFLDVGQAFLLEEGSFTGRKNNFSDLRFSPGLGVRYRTPIGPISVEYGFALDREDNEDFGRLHVSVGGAF